MLKQSLGLLLGIVYTTHLFAQDTTHILIESDTIRIGSMIIIRKGGKEQSKDSTTEIKITKRKTRKPSNISTNWFMLDIGFNNLVDRTNYASAAITGPNGYFPNGTESMLDLNNGKSVNVNIWFFMQRVNLIQHVVNLKYGLGLEMNNYRYRGNIRYRFEPRDFIERDPDVTSFRKNKLSADYITLPMMINFNFTPKREKSYGFSAGMSAGYLYASRQKMISELRGKEKVKDDFNLNPWKLSVIGEINLGHVKLYGSYTLNPMLRSGLDQTPYAVGLRFCNL